MTTRITCAVVASLVLAGASVRAHHSFAAEFDAAQPVTIQGVVTKLDWINPHSWIYLDVKGKDGQVEKWEVEAAGPTQLMRRGMRRTDFPIGIELQITGYRARHKPLVAAARTVRKLDGTEYFLSAPGTGAPN
jgi:hypothetical protein